MTFADSEKQFHVSLEEHGPDAYDDHAIVAAVFQRFAAEDDQPPSSGEPKKRKDVIHSH